MITINDYFKLNNGALTRSKIRDYELGPHYFYGRHVTGTIPKEDKQAFVIGSGVDDLLAQEDDPTLRLIESRNNYVVCDVNRQTKIGKEEWQRVLDSGKTPIKLKDYEEIMGLAIAVEETTAYKDLKTHKKQMLLQCPMDIGEHFQVLAALPDFIDITDRHATITDLKTSRTIDKQKYYFHARENGYYAQFALQIIILKKLGLIDTYDCRHLVVEKMKNVWNVATFKFRNDDIEREILRLWTIIDQIKEDKEFKKPDVSWDDAILLEDPRE